jgi:hypothetical protein
MEKETLKRRLEAANEVVELAAENVVAIRETTALAAVRLREMLLRAEGES